MHDRRRSQSVAERSRVAVVPVAYPVAVAATPTRQIDRSSLRHRRLDAVMRATRHKSRVSDRDTDCSAWLSCCGRLGACWTLRCRRCAPGAGRRARRCASGASRPSACARPCPRERRSGWATGRRSRSSSSSGARRSAAPSAPRSTRSSTRASGASPSRSARPWPRDGPGPAQAATSSSRSRSTRAVVASAATTRPCSSRMRRRRRYGCRWPWRSPVSEPPRPSSVSTDGAAPTTCGTRSSVRPPQREAVRGRWVILVDDVVTTGSTLCAAADALLAAGAVAVSAITVAPGALSGPSVARRGPPEAPGRDLRP